VHMSTRSQINSRPTSSRCKALGAWIGSSPYATHSPFGTGGGARGRRFLRFAPTLHAPFLSPSSTLSTVFPITMASRLAATALRATCACLKSCRNTSLIAYMLVFCFCFNSLGGSPTRGRCPSPCYSPCVRSFSLLCGLNGISHMHMSLLTLNVPTNQTSSA
jgi:hypothetical protein